MGIFDGILGSSNYDDLKKSNDQWSGSVGDALASVKDKLFPANADDARMAAQQKALQEQQAIAAARASAPSPLAGFLAAARGPAQDKLVGAPSVASPSGPLDIRPDPVMPPPSPPASPRTASVPVSAPTNGDLGQDFLARLQAQKTPLPPEAPQEAGAKAQPAQVEDELAKAQAEAARNAKMSHAGALFDRYASLLSGAPSGDATFARGEAEAQQGVKDVLTRREAAKQADAEKAAKALQDPNSDPSRLATKLAQSRGLIGLKDRITAGQWNLIKDAGSMQEASDKLAAEDKRTQAELASHEKEGDANRKNALQLERERTAGDLRRAQIEHGGSGGLKPMDASTIDKHSGAEKGAGAVANTMDDFLKVGGLGLVGRDSARFKTNRGSNGLDIAIGRSPLAREQLSANAEHLADNYTPSPSDTKQTAAAKMRNQMESIEAGLRHRIETFRAGGIDPAPLEKELDGVQREKARFYKLANPYLPPEQRLHAPHAQDEKAVEWAKGNPEDPRAKAILAANGG